MRATKSIKNVLLTMLLIIPFFGSISAQEHHKEEATEEELDVTEMILHHVGDSHSFHVYGSDEDHFPKALTIPLPVILWTNNGLVTFMSSEFHHDG